MGDLWVSVAKCGETSSTVKANHSKRNIIACSLPLPHEDGGHESARIVRCFAMVLYVKRIASRPQRQRLRTKTENILRQDNGEMTTTIRTLHGPDSSPMQYI